MCSVSTDHEIVTYQTWLTHTGKSHHCILTELFNPAMNAPSRCNNYATFTAGSNLIQSQASAIFLATLSNCCFVSNPTLSQTWSKIYFRPPFAFEMSVFMCPAVHTSARS